MEQINLLFEKVGLDPATFLVIVGLVVALTQWIKDKVNSMVPGEQKVLGGWRTELLVVVVAFGVSCFFLYPSWGSIALSTVICWIAPAGVVSVVRSKKIGGNI